MTHPPNDSSEGSNLLDQLAEEFVQRCRHGQRPALAEYTSRYPELADEIRELFPALVLMQDVKPQPGAATGPFEGERAAASPAALERLGDYRILREVGRGGMGIVYEAEQESLGRHVALKVLPAHALLDGQRLGRFQREAKAAARLHHTNIVPVYGVGEQDGLHYYVMQFIQGLALDEVLTELKKLRLARQAPTATGEEARPANRGSRVGDVSAVEVAQALLTGEFASAVGAASRAAPAGPARLAGPTADAPGSPSSDSSVRLPGAAGQSSLSESGRAYWQSVARVGIQVAEALAYAHGQGTLHRDIKPSNLLLDTHGTVWVTDFGLAKAADSDDLTHTGDIVGTLRYMAPERFTGQSDPRSDLYGLGLTLYELLTLRPAFGGADRHKLIEDVRHTEPPSPRRLNAEVPRDLETVVLKAMAKEPGHRYQTAAALAEDLKRFVEDRPIRARPVGSVERLWRWCRRNPVVAGLTAAVALLLVAVAVVSTVMAVRISGANVDLAAARTDADRQADAARNNAEEAQQARQREAGERRRAEDRLARLYVSNGSQALDRGDLIGSLPWFLEALKTDAAQETEQAGRGREAENHRVRLQAVLQQCPRVQFLYHDGPITRAEFSPDGRRVVTVGSTWLEAQQTWRPEARLWDLGTGQFIPLPHPDGLQLTEAAFSADGANVITAGILTDGSGQAGEARAWDAATGKPLGPPFKHNDNDAYSPPVLSPDGCRILTIRARPGPASVALAALGATTAVLMDTPLGQGLFAVLAAHFRATSHGEEVRGPSEAQVWDTATGKAVGPPFRYEGNKELLAARFSPDGHRVYTCRGRWDPNANKQEFEEQIWDAATGRPVTPVLMCRKMRYQVYAEFSGDGNRVFSQDHNGHAWIWDASTGQGIWRLDTNNPATWGFAVVAPSPDGRRLVTARGSAGTQIWDTATRKPVGERITTAAWHSTVFSRDSRRWLTVTDPGGGRGQEVRMYDADSGRPLSPPIPQDLPVSQASFSPDGSRVLTAGWQADSPGEARVWDAATGRPASPRLPFEGALIGASFSPDGRRVLVVSRDGKARLWDLATGRGARPTLEPGTRVGHPALSPDGRLTVRANAAYDGAQLWETATGRRVGPLFSLSPYLLLMYNDYYPASFSPNGRLVLLTGQRRVDHQASIARVLDAATGRPVTSIVQRDTQATYAEFSSDGRRVLVVLVYPAAMGKPEVKVWDVDPDRPLSPPGLAHLLGQGLGGQLLAPAGGPLAPVVQQLVACNLAKTVGFAPVSPPIKPGQQIFHATFSPDGRRVATATDEPGQVRVWDVGTGQPITPPLAEGRPASWVVFSPDGQRVATTSGYPQESETNEARIWDVASGRPLTPPLVYQNKINQVVFSADGRRLATASADRTARVWDAATGEPVTPPLRHDDGVKHAEFSPDGRDLLTATDSTVRVWDAATGEPVTPPLRPGADVSPAAFLADPSSARGTAVWWPRGSKVVAAVFASDGRQVLTLNDLHEVQVWDLSPDPRPLDDLARLVGLLSGRTIDATGGSSPVATSASDWQKLKAAYPETFTVPAQQAQAWTEAEAREQRRARTGEAAFYRDRGGLFAEQGQWEKADADFARACEYPGADVNAWYSHALLRLFLNDAKGYRQTCARMIKQFGLPNDAAVANTMAWTCCLGPVDEPDVTQAVQLAELAVKRNPQFKSNGAPGATLYRAGRYTEALQHLDEAVALRGKRDLPLYWLFLAMTHQRLGHAEEARKWLADAEEFLERPNATRPEQWVPRLELEILRGEARALINSKATDPAK
jgi:WD40 repeat protein/serine/threonine protein kinase